MLCVGNTLGIGYDVYKNLIHKNISSEFVSFHTIKPIDNNYLKKIFKQNKKIYLIEEHSKIGGGASAILEWAHENKVDVNNFFSFSLKDKFFNGLGEQKEARDKLGLNYKNIIKKILKSL